MDAELEGVPVSATDNHTPMPEATDELRERLRVVLAENGVDEAPATLHSWRCEYPVSYGKCDCIAELVNDLAAVVAEARTEGAIAELEAAANSKHSVTTVVTASTVAPPEYAVSERFDFNQSERARLLARAAALRGVGNQKVGVTVDDLALDEMDGNQNAEPRWSANRLEEVLREGLPDQNAEPEAAPPFVGGTWADQKGTEQ